MTNPERDPSETTYDGPQYYLLADESVGVYYGRARTVYAGFGKTRQDAVDHVERFFPRGSAGYNPESMLGGIRHRLAPLVYFTPADAVTLREAATAQSLGADTKDHLLALAAGYDRVSHLRRLESTLIQHVLDRWEKDRRNSMQFE